jgi:sporulation protein YlmC with PRC-barrel domain
MLSGLALALLTSVSALFGTTTLAAQVVGGTATSDQNVAESTQAMGWSVKHALMGKTLYNDKGAKVGTVVDLIVSSDKNVPYIVVAADSFVGSGRHDVAIPVSQIEERAGKLVMPGATRDVIKRIARFTYAANTDQRDVLVAAAYKDIADGETAVAALEKKAAAAGAGEQARIRLQITALRSDLKSADSALADMRHVGTARWKEFEVAVGVAAARLRKATAKAMA